MLDALAEMSDDESRDEDFLALAVRAVGQDAGQAMMYERLLRRGMRQTRERE